MRTNTGWLKYNPDSAKIVPGNDPYAEAELMELENGDFEEESQGGWGFDKPNEY